jgi:hypothetical protein
LRQFAFVMSMLRRSGAVLGIRDQGEAGVHTPVLHHHLPHRRAGSFGTSIPGQVAEWLTTTWFRFGSFATWWLILPLIMSGTPGNPLATAGMLVVSPILAAGFYVTLKGSLMILYFVPVTRVVVAYARLAWLWVFSRLIVQEAPEIALPMWSARSH